MVAALSQEPALIILRLTADGAVESRTWIDTPEVVGWITVAPDDRYAWLWSASTAYVLDLANAELHQDRELAACSTLTPAAIETASGYVVVGVRNEDDGRDIGRCALSDDGRFESFEATDVPPPGYADDREP